MSAHLPAELPAQVVTASEALGATLKEIRMLQIDKAGRPLDTGLFQARRELLKEWSLFVHTAENVYGPKHPDSAAAREALIGPWRRLLASGAVIADGEEPVLPSPTDAGAPAGPVAGSDINLPPPFLPPGS